MLLFPALIQAQSPDITGSVGFELRAFPADAQFLNQFNGLEPSADLQPEFQLDSEDGKEQFDFLPFFRLDGRDQRRTHADIRELYWRHIGDGWELLAGISRVFWGVSEFRHLVDVINQTDLIEDIDAEDKLGQPMLNLSTQQDWGEVSLFVMPGFRERTFPGKNGRLRFPLVTDGNAQYQSSKGRKHIDVAARYSHYIGDWDFGIAYFNGTGRDPRFIANDNGTRAIPVYDLIKQVGTDIQFTYEAWLWKFEGLWRSQHGDKFLAAIGGFEYTLFQLANTNADLGLLFEYSYDGRDKNPAQAPPTAFEGDYFLGARLALNDVQDTTLLMGVALDPDESSSTLSLEAEHRLSQHWSAEAEGRWFMTSGDDRLLSAFKQDSFVTLKLVRYF
ncbi:FIG01201466: hypothetical protein [hydrothermal vent metagenome]|uniref:Alginate export domain-containing protein n=1 Tax=hydrothermal vent metagenome TaxID=652676 RepID=A0A3B0YT42_9ZZZZ